MSFSPSAPGNGPSVLGAALAFGAVAVIEFGFLLILAQVLPGGPTGPEFEVFSVWVVGLVPLGVVGWAARRAAAVPTVLGLSSVGLLTMVAGVGVIAGTRPLLNALRIVLVGAPYSADGADLSLALTWVNMIGVALVAPLGEELFFRGYLLRAFGRSSPWLGIGVTAVLFGLAHPSGGAGLVLHGAFGLAAAFVVVASGSVWPSVIGHSLTNLLVFVGADVMSAASWPWCLAGGAVVLAGALWLLRRPRGG